MATSPTVAKAKTTASQPGAQAAPVDIPGISRREFLNYAWLGSMALLTAQTGGLLVWFMLPKFREGEFGGTFTLTSVPIQGSAPMDNPQGKFWLTHSEAGVTAIYKVCTHLGCLYKWVDANERFECPCHGSKFQLSGQYIEGPAPRSLDRFVMTIETSGGVFTTDAEGNPIPGIDPASVRSVQIDTGSRIKRAGRD